MITKQSTLVSPDDTGSLITRIRAGDASARDQLFRRYLPVLQRWAHGRLPTTNRDVAETDDLVQATLIRALNRIESFEVRFPGSLLAYLRQILLNEIRREIRHFENLPSRELVFSEMVDDDMPTMLEHIVGSEQLQAYQQALGSLPKRQQGLLIMRIEFGMSFPEIALEAGATIDAVRVMVGRAAANLARRVGAYLGPHQP